MLELKDICKTYKSKKGAQTQALKDVSLSFPDKGLVFVLGKSGCGKSTLLNVIGAPTRDLYSYSVNRGAGNPRF